MEHANLENVAAKKRELRERMMQLRKDMTTEQRQRWSEAACELAWHNVQQLLQKSDAPLRVFAYMPTEHELNILPLMERLRSAGHMVHIPRTIREKTELLWYAWTEELPLQRRKLGILEPDERAVPISEASIAQTDLILVPGLAYDRRGGRLGMGAGYYDRFLSRWPELQLGWNTAHEKKWRDPFNRDTTLPLLWSLIYNWQLIECVPMEQHDIPIHAMVTEEKWMELSISEC